jgi:hypothetical protein
LSASLLGAKSIRLSRPKIVGHLADRIVRGAHCRVQEKKRSTRIN